MNIDVGPYKLRQGTSGHLESGKVFEVLLDEQPKYIGDPTRSIAGATLASAPTAYVYKDNAISTDLTVPAVAIDSASINIRFTVTDAGATVGGDYVVLLVATWSDGEVWNIRAAISVEA